MHDFYTNIMTHASSFGHIFHHLSKKKCSDKSREQTSKLTESQGIFATMYVNDGFKELRKEAGQQSEYDKIMIYNLLLKHEI